MRDSFTECQPGTLTETPDYIHSLNEESDLYDLAKGPSCGHVFTPLEEISEEMLHPDFFAMTTSEDSVDDLAHEEVDEYELLAERHPQSYDDGRIEFGDWFALYGTNVQGGEEDISFPVREGMRRHIPSEEWRRGGWFSREWGLNRRSARSNGMKPEVIHFYRRSQTCGKHGSRKRSLSDHRV